MINVKTYGNPSADIAIIRLLGAHESNIDGEIELLSKEASNRAWCVLAVEIENWEYEMSPWPTHIKTSNDMSEYDNTGAGEKLNSITERIIPEYEAEYPNSERVYILAGYSLAGLFSLWASYQTDKFNGIMAASPSVWYPGWMEYIKENDCKANIVYLSLGNKEHKTRHPLMSGVADNIRKQKEVLANQGIETIYEENKGNHFKDVTERMVKGYRYLLEK